MTSSITPTTATAHPLAPLTADEVQAATEILTASDRIAGGSRFVSVSLHEPPKKAVLAWDGVARLDREAFAVVYDRGGRQLYEAVVSITRRDVVRCEPIPGAMPSYLLEEVFAVTEVIMGPAMAGGDATSWHHRPVAHAHRSLAWRLAVRIRPR